ncbi:MAG: RdgB/HAM1 family non-canonical purine NTP pyrophosphatase [Armatimonadota bacterium]
MKILMATDNKHKVKEIKNILKGTGIELCTPKDLGIKNTDVKENGKTYFANALKKAKAFAKMTNLPVLADDSGLEIKILDNKPGILSSRFIGKDTPFYEKNLKILEKLKSLPKSKRSAKFVCCCVLIAPSGKVFKTTGQCAGFIYYKITGKHGFGYDPVFYLPAHEKTMAQISMKEKNKISHRAKAFLKMKKYILKYCS